MNEGTGTLSSNTGGTGRGEFGWRNTPRINFAPERPIIPFSPLVAIFVIVLLVEAWGAHIAYGRLRDAEADAVAAADRLEDARQALDQERAATDAKIAEFQTLETENKRIKRQDAGVIEVYDQLTRKRPEWAVAMQALLQAENSGFQPYRLTARPSEKNDSPPMVNVFATVAGADRIDDFLNHMKSVKDVLELVNWRTSSERSRGTGGVGPIMFQAAVILK